MAKWKGFIRQKRLEMGLTQKDLAKAVGVSQGFVSKWEKEDQVPLEMEDKWNEAVGLSKNTNLLDIPIAGSPEAADAWFAFLERFIEDFAEGGGCCILDNMAEMGIHRLFEPLTRRGFAMPTLPIFLQTSEEEEEESIIQYASEDDRYFFEEVLYEFLFWHDNFSSALECISNAEQIDIDHYFHLIGGSEEYIWANILTQFVNVSKLENRNYFGDLVVSFIEVRREFENDIADAWYHTYLKANSTDRSSAVNFPPVWKAAQLIEAANNDISASFDFDFHGRILRGEPLDTTYSEILHRLDYLTEMIASLHEKVGELSTAIYDQ